VLSHPVKASWIQPQNLARGKPATQSSTSEWSRPNDAQGAVDGRIDGNFGFHTDREPAPWWQVDLGEVVPLAEARIFNRLLPEAKSRTRTLRVLLSHDGSAWRQVYAHDGEAFGGGDGRPLVVDLKNAAARYVRLQLNEYTWLHLDEVEIYGR
jgi:hypothetical protein